MYTWYIDIDLNIIYMCVNGSVGRIFGMQVLMIIIKIFAKEDEY